MAYPRDYGNDINVPVECQPRYEVKQSPGKSYGPTEEVDREIPQVVQRLECGLSDLSEAIDSITARLLPAMSPGRDVNQQGAPVHAMSTGLGGVLQEQVNRVNVLNEHVRDIRNRLQL